MIAVVGSVNRDLIVMTDALPEPGETVLGSDHVEAPGGKGANQAVAAARLGSEVAFVGRVGDDDAGRTLAAAFATEGIDIEHLAVSEQAPTGLAVITVDAEGENTIVVSQGANGLVGVADVAAARNLLDSASATLLQLEIPIATVIDAAAAAAGTVILNAAPAQALPDALLEVVDVLVVNGPELEAITGFARPEAARQLPVQATVVTLGAEGAALVSGDDVTPFPAPRVQVVDATGAGDAFCGALAAAIDAGLKVEEAMSRAVAAGSLATTAVGARSAMPTPAELEAALRTQWT